MAAADATFSESTPRLIGIRTAWSAAASQRSDSPSPSPPISSATLSAGSRLQRADRDRGRVGRQRQQPEPGRPQLGQAAAPVGQPGVRHGQHGAHRHLDRAPVQRVGAPRRKDHAIEPESRGAAEDRADVRVVDDVLKNDNPAGDGQDVRHRGSGSRCIEASAPRCTRYPVSCSATAGGSTYSGARAASGDLARSWPACPSADQERTDRIPGGDGAPDYLLALGDEQALRCLQAAAQVHVGQPDVIGEPRVARIARR